MHVHTRRQSREESWGCRCLRGRGITHVWPSSDGVSSMSSLWLPSSSGQVAPTDQPASPPVPPPRPARPSNSHQSLVRAVGISFDAIRAAAFLSLPPFLLASTLRCQLYTLLLIWQLASSRWLDCFRAAHRLIWPVAGHLALNIQERRGISCGHNLFFGQRIMMRSECIDTYLYLYRIEVDGVEIVAMLFWAPIVLSLNLHTILFDSYA